jgi:cephalosporin hydroxylase
VPEAPGRPASLTGPVRATVDFARGTIAIEDASGARLAEHPLATAEGFAAAADIWLRAGWDAKYVYGFTWLGRPVIQLPDDLMTLQELVWREQPDVIVETGIAHGGSLVFHAGLCRLMGKGRVVGIDIEIRPHNRAALDAHPLRPLIELIEGDSVASATLERVRALLRPSEKVMVILDGAHTRVHVLAELRAYGPLVTPGSCIVAMDGIMARLPGAPRSRPEWAEDNPRAAVEAFVAEDARFALEPPQPPFNEGAARGRPSYINGGFLRRVS